MPDYRTSGPSSVHSGYTRDLDMNKKGRNKQTADPRNDKKAILEKMKKAAAAKKEG
ncbi:hypothetical protein [Marivivens niveibacter]|uniref:hypothetical protein n=1 Tax=Marivivens niveibacter TaxID=1930667 RepID=UPI0013FD1D9A|nr:hypothetical protein [Marivivens niveibacter]